MNLVEANTKLHQNPIQKAFYDGDIDHVHCHACNRTIDEVTTYYSCNGNIICESCMNVLDYDNLDYRIICDIQQLVESIIDHRSCNHMDAECTPDELAGLNGFYLEQIEYLLTGGK